MAKNNKRTKFHFNEKVKVLDGFYRTHEGVVKSVKTHFLNEPKYLIEIRYNSNLEEKQSVQVTGTTYTLSSAIYNPFSHMLPSTPSTTHSFEIEVSESDLCHGNFNKKLNEIVNGD